VSLSHQHSDVPVFSSTIIIGSHTTYDRYPAQSSAPTQPTTDTLHNSPHPQASDEAALSIDMNLLSSDNAGPILAIRAVG
jgi:hypothetical protein